MCTLDMKPKSSDETKSKLAKRVFSPRSGAQCYKKQSMVEEDVQRKVEVALIRHWPSLLQHVESL